MNQMKTDNENKVVGLKYEPGEGVPTVILKGSGETADSIIELAKKIKGPEIVEDKELLKKLYRMPIDAEISPELYDLVALVLAHVFTVEDKFKRDLA
jgi:type III secretion system FlhB-like substrate exporter